MGFMGGIAGAVRSFTGDSAEIFRLANKATGGGTSLTQSFPDTADATVNVFVTTPTLVDLQKMSMDSKATHKLVFEDPDLNIERGDRVVVNGNTLEIESVRDPSTPKPYLTAFGFAIQPGRGNA